MSLSRRTFAASLAGTSLLRAQTTPAASKDQPPPAVTSQLAGRMEPEVVR